ncbi:hypothetical protein [Pendulispora albinea]|uniref:Lipoprotein n=1 Tax=Pendulispora albinea TaxID=2741071 RepID=A0ABZ2M1X9_9BACT
MDIHIIMAWGCHETRPTCNRSFVEDIHSREESSMILFEKVSALRGVIALGFVQAIFISACAHDVDDAPDLKGLNAETTDDGAIQSVSKPEGTNRAALNAEGTAPNSSDQVLIGCVHIRWCNAPGPDEVVCDTDDRPCTRQQRLDECIADANYGCGNWTYMRFDPPI